MARPIVPFEGECADCGNVLPLNDNGVCTPCQDRKDKARSKKREWSEWPPPDKGENHSDFK